jgi:hypothetical protein
MLVESVNTYLDELINLLDQLDDESYSAKCEALSNSSIGEHTRHIIEMFKSLEHSYDSGILNYDSRKRNNQIQTETAFAKKLILEIKLNLRKENKTMYLEQQIDELTFRIESNYYRELLYNLEHCIHHQALIKVAVIQLENNIVLNENFGVARSTIQYRNQCAQ